MAGEIEKWITINGAHIPIIKGESRAKAVSNFIKRKRDAVKGKRRSLYAKWNDLERILHRADQQEDWETYNEYSKDYDKAAKAAKDFDAKHPERTIRGRAKTRDEIEDERFDKYDEYAHNAARNIRFDNRKNPLSQDELYDRAHAVADASSMYDMDYKYGKGGTHENKQVSINDKIREARYKLKVDKKTIRGAITDKERRANKAALPYKEKREKYEAQGDKYYEKAQSEPRNTTGSDNRFHSAMSKMSIAYEKAHNADSKAGEKWLKAYYSKKKYAYKRKK